MLYLIDANVLITANANYYPIDRIPPFWDWLYQEALDGHIKMPFEIHQEIAVSNKGPLKDWITDPDVESALILDEEVDYGLFNTAVDQGYAPDLTDHEMDEIGNDPFLVAHALINTAGRGVVTKEVSKPSKTRANGKLPDVCAQFGVTCIDDFELYRRREFKIVR